MKYEILFEGPRRFRPRPSRGRDIGSRILLTRTGIQMHLKVENLLTNEKYVYQLIRVVWRSRVERTNHRSVYEPFSVLVYARRRLRRYARRRGPRGNTCRLRREEK